MTEQSPKVLSFPQGRNADTSAAARRIRGAVCSLFFGLVASPLAADAFDDLAPCLSRHSSLDTLTADFLAAGWTHVADGPEREHAAAATSEINWALRFSPSRFRTVEQAAEFLDTAHRSHELRTDPYALLGKDGLSLILEWSANSRRGQNICLLAARSLDYVTAAIPAAIRDAAAPPALSVIELRLLQAPSEIKYVKTALVRIRVPEAARNLLAGGDGAQMSVSYGLK